MTKKLPHAITLRILIRGMSEADSIKALTIELFKLIVEDNKVLTQRIYHDRIN